MPVQNTTRVYPQEKTDKRPTRQAVGDSLVRAHWSTLDAVLLSFSTPTKINQKYTLVA